MQRYYAVKMANGAVYGIPAEVIAEMYARSQIKGGQDVLSRRDNIQIMLDRFDAQDTAFSDWARKELAWMDVQDYAALIESGDRGETLPEESWKTGEYAYVQK